MAHPLKLLLSAAQQLQFQKHLENFREELFQNSLKNSPKTQKLQLFKATQKRLYTILFTLFAQKRALLDTNTLKSLCSGLQMEDKIINKGVKILLEYDLCSNSSLNVLGRFFESSMSVREELLEKTFDKKESKRKQEGIFYTPEHIAKQMVLHTLAKMCEAKRKELQIDRSKNEGQLIQKNLLMYKKWLLGLKILDPACGCGAFLNQALFYLLGEHKRVHDTLVENSFVAEEFDKELLLQNIYGVDIDEDAVEIARVSLWLATAKKGQTKRKLSNNIKAANALIDDVSVVPNALEWHKEFAEVFAYGGFDLIIGNPPYLGARTGKNEAIKRYYAKNYTLAQQQFDIYILFFELALRLGAHDGFVSFITPNSWLNNQSNQKLRQMILEQTSVVSLVDYSKEEVFERVKVFTLITTLQKSPQKKSTQIYGLVDGNLALMYQIEQNIWLSNAFCVMNITLSPEDSCLLKKIESQSTRLDAIAKIKFGVKLYEKGAGTPKQEASFSKEHIYESNRQIECSYQKYLSGKDIHRYGFCWENTWVKYGKNLAAPRDEQLFKNKRILLRRVVGNGLIATSLDENYITSQLLQIVKLENDKLTNSVTALLNSALMSYFFKKKYNRQNKRFPEIRIYELAALPIAKEIFFDTQIEAKVELLIRLKKNLQESSGKDDALQKEIKSVEGEIESMVYKLYALNENEILHIEGKNNDR